MKIEKTEFKVQMKENVESSRKNRNTEDILYSMTKRASSGKPLKDQVTEQKKYQYVSITKYVWKPNSRAACRGNKRKRYITPTGVRIQIRLILPDPDLDPHLVLMDTEWDHESGPACK